MSDSRSSQSAESPGTRPGEVWLARHLEPPQSSGLPPRPVACGRAWRAQVSRCIGVLARYVSVRPTPGPHAPCRTCGSGRIDVYTPIYGFPLLERPGEKMILSHCEAAQVRGPGVLTTGWPVNDDDAATWRLDGGVCPGSSFAISQFSILEPSLFLEGIERPSLVLRYPLVF